MEYKVAFTELSVRTLVVHLLFRFFIERDVINEYIQYGTHLLSETPPLNHCMEIKETFAYCLLNI